MKPPKTITKLSDLECSHCVLYRNDYKPDYSTCHISPIAFETNADNICSDALFVWVSEKGEDWVLNLQDAILRMLNGGRNDE